MLNSIGLFRNRTILVASMHGKEKVMGPILEKALELNTRVAEGFDTDILGTFAGEIERTDDPLTTLRKKCTLAMERNQSDLAIGNEGSFGSHPGIFFLNADEELVMLIDKKHGLEIVAREISTKTNFSGVEVDTEKQLLSFARKALFPSHGLILRNARESKETIVKGITNEEHLLRSFQEIWRLYGSAFVETDMRAMFNPTRMNVIRKATEKLIAKLDQLCPECNAPGFDVDRSEPGLRCSLCGRPTLSAQYQIYLCKYCNYTHQKNTPHGKANEDPMYCQFCNP